MPTRAMKNDGVEAAMGKNGIFKDVGKEEEKGSLKNSCNQTVSCSDESSSSIGRNSDASMEKSSGGEEVQSSFKGTFDAAIQALEEVLPIRRGISRFYNGKSNSFACLADASSSPVAKPENAYKRRRRNVLACSLLTWDKNRSSSHSSNGGGISKRVTASSRRAMALNKNMENVVVMDHC